MVRRKQPYDRGRYAAAHKFDPLFILLNIRSFKAKSMVTPALVDNAELIGWNIEDKRGS